MEKHLPSCELEQPVKVRRIGRLVIYADKPWTKFRCTCGKDTENRAPGHGTTSAIDSMSLKNQR